MRLFLAEKPSVGREISKYLLGKGIKHDGYIDHGEDVVTWAFGHMLEQAEPGEYNEKYLRWNAQDLPIIPNEWKLLITKSSAKQFDIIKRLLERADSVVHAGDPDREGQLLIDEILVYLGFNKPVQRILINALDEKSMKDALQDLRNNQDFFNLRQSALARSRADWLIGMNLSRAYTLAARFKGHKVTFPIGRVKTPTLALVVRREEELNAFTPVQYYTVQGLYEYNECLFKANWKPKDTQAGLDAEDRLLDRNKAEELVARLLANPLATVVEREKKKKKEYQRLPLSLSALQVLAGKLHGYDPQQVLETAQSLYEKKLTTYPRSDCDYLPESQYKDSKLIVKNLQTIEGSDMAQWANQADTQIRSKAWNDKKITAHHAIIPTTVRCPWHTLNEREKDIYTIISQAYLAQFYPVHEYDQTRIVLDHGGETFIANGRVVTVVGWKSLYGMVQDEEENSKIENQSDSGELPILKKGNTVVAQSFEIQEKTTKPPSRFTSATLLQAMKEIHKYVKNDDVKKQLKDVSGIGTEATRATIISDLITRKFMTESGKKKVLKPTETAYLMIHALPDELSYPDETAFWEERLARMSHGEDSLESFLKDQIIFLTNLVQKALGRGTTLHGGADCSIIEDTTIRNCPKCKSGKLYKRKGKYGEFWGCSAYPKCKYTEPIQAMKDSGEGRQDTVETNILLKDEEKIYKCPRCKEGYFVCMTNNGNKTWVCNRRSTCKTKCADVDGKPSIYAHKG